MTGVNDERLLELLLQAHAAGHFKLEDVVPALRELIGGEGAARVTLAQIHDALQDRSSPAFRKLLGRIRELQLRNCFFGHGVLKSGGSLEKSQQPELAALPAAPPVDWREEGHLVALIHRSAELITDRYFLATHEIPSVIGKVNAEIDDARREFEGVPGLWNMLGMAEDDSAARTVVRAALEEFPDEIPGNLDEQLVADELAEMCLREGEVADHQQLLDLLLCCRSDAAAAAIRRCCVGEEDRWRSMQVLMLRFGQAKLTTWEQWDRWLDKQSENRARRVRRLRELGEQYRTQLTCLRSLWAQETDGYTDKAMVALAAAVPAPVFAGRWRQDMEISEYLTLTGQSEKLAAPPEEPAETPQKTEPVAAEAQATELDAEKVEAKVEEEPVELSAWEEHVRPFLMENWYMVAGLCMVLIGAALLAYYTWNKHWAVRYTLMPLLMGGFTFGFAALGNWLQKRTEQFRTTAIILRAGAVALLPINFMALCLFASELADNASISASDLTYRMITMGIMGGIYIVIYGFGLRRWCRQVLPAMGPTLALPLMLLNAFVVGGAFLLLSKTEYRQELLLALLYAGGGVLLFGVWRFASRTLNDELVSDRPLIWFYGASTLLCFLEVFIGLHFFFRALPKPSDYAILVILAGAGVLFIERVLIQYAGKLEEKDKYQEESFLGYALLCAGVLMGLGDEYVRVAAFILAGLIWTVHARRRRQVVHGWIGLLLISMGLAAIGAIEAFPRSAPWNAVGFLSLGVVLTIGIARALFIRVKEERLAGIANECMGILAVIAVGAVTISQWFFRAGSEPLWTALQLLILAGLLAWRAIRSEKLSWVHSAMAIVVLALPYLGCVDMTDPGIKGNTMVFGIAVVSLLWIAAIHWRPLPVLVAARSTVLWCTGTLAVAAMCLRVLLERNAVSPNLTHQIMDNGGPFLMALALVAATWYSRSLIPAAMASAILAILFPELKAEYRQTAEMLGYGSGFGSAVSAGLLVIACFVVDRWKRLADLPDGDLYMGEKPFPLRRHDATLFTLPMAATAVFLVTKVSTWNLVRNLLAVYPHENIDLLAFVQGQVSLRGCLALLITAVGWVLVAVYFRKHKGFARGCVHLSWAIGLLGFYLLDRHRAAPAYQWPVIALILTMVVVVGIFTLQKKRLPWMMDLLVVQYVNVLRVGSIALSACLSIYLVLYGRITDCNYLVILLLILIGAMTWIERRRLLGHAWFWLILTSVLAVVCGNSPIYAPAGHSASGMWAVIGVPLIFQALQLGLELRPAIGRRLHAYMQPAHIGAVIIALLAVPFWLGVFAFNSAPEDIVTLPQQAALLALLLILARANGSLWLGVLFVGTCYTVTLEQLDPGGAGDRIIGALTLWRVTALCLATMVLAQIIRIVRQRYPKLISGPWPLLRLRVPSLKILMVLVTIVVIQFTMFHGIYFFVDESASQLATGYFAAATLLLIFWIWDVRAFLGIAVILEAFANIHVVRYLYDWLSDTMIADGSTATLGLSALHIAALGLGLSLLQQLVKKWVVRGIVNMKTDTLRQHRSDFLAQNQLSIIERLRDQQAALNLIFSRSALVVAGCILGLLTLNYIADPGVGGMSNLRFVVSGLMALAAGMYFRWTARSATEISPRKQKSFIAMYHFGISMAIWCVLLLIPVLRHRSLAFVALMGAPVFFWIRTEMCRKSRPGVAAQYCTTAMILIFLMIGIYMCQPIFEIILYPPRVASELLQATALENAAAHYHTNAAFVMILGLMALRLYGLGASSWIATYGGVAFVTGAYMLLTWWGYPKVSPFTNQLPAAGLAVLLGHLLIVGTHQRSPLRSWLQELGRISDEQWHMLRRNWGWAMMCGVQVMVVLGALDYKYNSYMVAPLILFSVSILIHQFVVSGRVLYLALAGVELLVALHVDFLLPEGYPSYLEGRLVVWALAALWIGVLVAHKKWPEKLAPKIVGALSSGFAVLLVVHMFWVHHPASATGLAIMAVCGILAAVIPLSTESLDKTETKVYAIALFVAPIWIGYFSQSTIQVNGWSALLDTWPAMTAAAVAFVVGQLCVLYQRRGKGSLDLEGKETPRLFNQLASHLSGFGRETNLALLGLVFAVQVISLSNLVFFRKLEDVHLLALLLGLFIATAWAWWNVGREQASRVAYLLAEACLAGGAIVVRHVLVHSMNWDRTYDVWVMLAVSFCLTAFKRTIDDRPKELRVSWTWTVLLLPIFAVAWTVYYGLGANTAMIVLGLHALMFTYLGKDRRESPYNALAVVGYVGFLLTLFGSRDVHFAHAYIIPVGLGNLALLQLFGRRMEAATRNRIRLVTLLAMLGSAGWYALADDNFPIIFNLTMIVLSLAAMGLGGLMRIRLYLFLGFAGLVVDLLSLLYKGIRRMEQAYQMASIGVLLLLAGAGVVLGTVWYKTHQETVSAWLKKWRTRLGDWE